MENDNNFVKDILSETLGNLKSIIDVDTVMGDPLKMADGTTIIPITKVSVGFVSGGGEYSGENIKKKFKYPFSGGSGAGFSIKPIGFLVGKNDNFKIISINDEPAYKKLADIVTELAKTYVKTQVEKTKQEQAQTQEKAHEKGVKE